MLFVDVQGRSRVEREPDGAVCLFGSGRFVEQGFVVRRVDLRQYVEGTDPGLGPLSLITAVVETDRGTVEMTYDEGYRGENALDDARAFLVSNLGISGLVLRSVISLREHLGDS